MPVQNGNEWKEVRCLQLSREMTLSNNCLDRCNEVQDMYYIPTLHQFIYEIEDGYRKDNSPVRIGHDDEKFPGYSWRGYGSYSQLQNEVNAQVL